MQNCVGCIIAGNFFLNSISISVDFLDESFPLIVLNAVRILSASALECLLERSFADAYCACGYADADEWNKRRAFQLVLYFCRYGQMEY